MPSSYRRAAAFCAEDIRGTLRGVPDEETHLWMARLDVDGNPLLAELLRRRGPNRRDRHRGEALPHSWLHIHLAGDLEKMDDLGRGGKERHVELASANRACRGLQRLEVFRKRIPVDR